MKARLLLAAAAASVCSVAANATAYTDEAAWRAAVSGVYALETFDSIPALSDVTALPALNLRFLPLNDGTQPTVQPYASTGGVVKSGPNNLLNDRDYSLPGRGPINVVPLDGTDLVYGIGMWNVGGDDQLRLTFYDALDNVIEEVTSSPAFGFFGIVNVLGAARAQVDFVGGNQYSPTDDWQTAVRGTFEPEPTVPEPATWMMLISGFAVVGGIMRRRAATVRFV